MQAYRSTLAPGGKAYTLLMNRPEYYVAILLAAVNNWTVLVGDPFLSYPSVCLGWFCIVMHTRDVIDIPFFSIRLIPLLFPIYHFESIQFDTLCLGYIMPEYSTPFLPISLSKAIENTSILSQFHFALV